MMKRAVTDTMRQFFGLILFLEKMGAFISSILSIVNRTSIHVEKDPAVVVDQIRIRQNIADSSSGRCPLIPNNVSGTNDIHKTTSSVIARISRNTVVGYFRSCFLDRIIMFKMLPQVPINSKIKGTVLHSQYDILHSIKLFGSQFPTK
jgi:hypothetical protein